MLHPSTKHLIDRIGDMTANGKLEWVESGDGTFRFETKGYGIELAGSPARITILTPEGKTVEQAESAVLAGTPHDTDTNYEMFVFNLAGRVRDQIGERQKREEADTAIKTILTGLDLDGDGVPDVYVPADEAHAVSAADSVTDAAATDAAAIEDDGEETRFSGAETVEVAEPEIQPAAEVSVAEPGGSGSDPVDAGIADDRSAGVSAGGAAFAAGVAAFGTAAALASGDKEAASEPSPQEPAPETSAQADHTPPAGLTPVAETVDAAAPSLNTEMPGIKAFGSSDAVAAENEPEAEVVEPIEEQPSAEASSEQGDPLAPRPQTIAFGAGLAGTLVPDGPAENPFAEPEQATTQFTTRSEDEFSSGVDTSTVPEGTDFATSAQEVAEAAGDVVPDAPAEAGIAPADAVEEAPAPVTGFVTGPVADTQGFGFGTVGQTVAGLAGEASEAAGSVVEDASEGVSGVTDAASDAAQSLTNEVSETLGEAADTRIDTFAGTTDGLTDIAAGFGETTQDGLATAAGTFGEAAADVRETVSDSAETAGNTVGETVSSFADAAVSTIADATGFSSVPEQPVEAAGPEEIQPEVNTPTAEDNAALGLSSVFGGMGGAVQSAASSMGEAARNVVDTVTGNNDKPAEEASEQANEDEDVKPDNKPGGRFNPWM